MFFVIYSEFLKILGLLALWCQVVLGFFCIQSILQCSFFFFFVNLRARKISVEFRKVREMILVSHQRI